MLLHLLRATRLFRHERDGSLGQICREKQFPHPSPYSKCKEPEGPYRALLTLERSKQKPLLLPNGHKARSSSPANFIRIYTTRLNTAKILPYFNTSFSLPTKISFHCYTTILAAGGKQTKKPPIYVKRKKQTPLLNLPLTLYPKKPWHTGANKTARQTRTGGKQESSILQHTQSRAEGPAHT